MPSHTESVLAHCSLAQGPARRREGQGDRTAAGACSAASAGWERQVACLLDVSARNPLTGELRPMVSRVRVELPLEGPRQRAADPSSVFRRLVLLPPCLVVSVQVFLGYEADCQAATLQFVGLECGVVADGRRPREARQAPAAARAFRDVARAAQVSVFGCFTHITSAPCLTPSWFPVATTLESSVSAPPVRDLLCLFCT